METRYPIPPIWLGSDESDKKRIAFFDKHVAKLGKTGTLRFIIDEAIEFDQAKKARGQDAS